MARKPILAASVSMALLLAGAAGALGNGGYIPERAFPAMPEIPTQRALIVYRNGLETLVVESTFKTDSPGVGWILPLPAEPIRMEVADSGMLTSLAVCLRPAVIHDLLHWEHLWIAVPILGFLVPMCLIAIVSRRGLALLDVLVWTLVYLLIVAVCLPAGFGAGESGPEVGGVQVKSTERVGNYEVSVVLGKDSRALSQWLQGSGLRPLDGQASRIVDDYIARGWCFAVARLHRPKGGEATPHPISVSFHSPEPVYPMRLTSIAGSKTHVELYVIAERMAGAYGFRLSCADRFGEFNLWHRDLKKDVEVFVADSVRLAVGSHALVGLMWDGCVVTRLEADLSPQAMDKDVALRFEDLGAHRDKFYSPRGRRQAVLSVLAWGAIPVTLCCAMVCNKRRRPTKRQGRVLIGLVLAVFASALAVSYWHPTMPVGPSFRAMDMHLRPGMLKSIARSMAHDGHLHSGLTPEELARFPIAAVERRYLAESSRDDWRINPFTGAPVRFECSPGNFATRRVEDKTWLCTYDEDGVEIPLLELPPPPSGKQIQPKRESE
jgi:hypothetical protein